MDHFCNPAILALYHPDYIQIDIKRCTHGKLKILDELTYWLHHEDPTRVNTLMLEFIEQDIEDIV